MDIHRNHTLSQLQDTKDDILAGQKKTKTHTNKKNEDKAHEYSSKSHAFIELQDSKCDALYSSWVRVVGVFLWEGVNKIISFNWSALRRRKKW